MTECDIPNVDQNAAAISASVCRVISIGGLSDWGRQFLSQLSERHIIAVHTETPAEFSNGANYLRYPATLIVENSSENQAMVLGLRQSTKSFYLLLFGQSFSKEDMAFALTTRSYRVFENPDVDSSAIRNTFALCASLQHTTELFENLIVALKTSVSQLEPNDSLYPFATEVKTALSKLEKCAIHNDHCRSQGSSMGPQDNWLLPRAQIEDALMTTNELERTGSLRIRMQSLRLDGHIDFIQGQIVSASAGRVRGLKAIYRMFLWLKPHIVFIKKNVQDILVEDEPIHISVHELCVQGELHQKRHKTIQQCIPSGDARYQCLYSGIDKRMGVSQEKFSTLASVIEFGRLKAILDYNPLPDITILESLKWLTDKGMIATAN